MASRNRIGASREKISAVNIYIYIYTRDFSIEDVPETEKLTLAKLKQIASNTVCYFLGACLKQSP